MTALAHPAYGRLRPVTDTASVLLCNNPGLMTLDGTNTWVLRGPGSDEMVVVDPGPEDDEHIAKIAELGKIPLVLISHKHELYGICADCRLVCGRAGIYSRSGHLRLAFLDGAGFDCIARLSSEVAVSSERIGRGRSAL